MVDMREQNIKYLNDLSRDIQIDNIGLRILNYSGWCYIPHVNNITGEYYYFNKSIKEGIGVLKKLI